MKKTILVVVAAIVLSTTDASSACRFRGGRICGKQNCALICTYRVSSSDPSPHRVTAEAPPATRVVTIKGKQYRIIPHPDKGNELEDEREMVLTAPERAAASTIPAADRFAGTARRIAKTNILAESPEQFSSVSAFLDWLPPNSEMEGTIASTATTDRVPKERHNVTVGGFIYAFKKEGDNDYHVILGDAPESSHANYVNTEVSGIPTGGSNENRTNLWSVRNAFKSSFDLGAAGPSSYYRPDPPVPVRMTGSIFWDVDHENPPYVGPQDFKPHTPWEIHPISAIEF